MSDLVIIESLESVVLVGADEPIVLIEADESVVVTVGVPGPPGQTGAPGGSQVELPTRAALSGHRAIAVDADGYAIYASAADAVSVLAYAGVSLGAVTDGGSLSVRAHGELIEPSWAWTPGLPLFIGLNGALTQTAPAGVQRQIGVALSATRIFLMPQIGVITV